MPDLLPKFQANKHEGETHIANAKIVAMLRERFEGAWFEAKDVLMNPVESPSPLGAPGSSQWVNTGRWLNEFRSLFGDTGIVDAKRVASRFRFFRGQNLGGLKLEQEMRTSKSKKASRWRVVLVDAEAAGLAENANESKPETPEAA
ncbi:MAG: hypothetical protein GVY22_02695 [Gammaproteobacteria bacterium]|nr:hypothetical protein [Gammaproteobacteria bacterium]